ncbi:MAG: M1 family metallopeptidase [Vicinamibacteria bacterium]
MRWALALVACLAAASVARARPQAPPGAAAAAERPAPASAADLLRQLDAAWRAEDVAAYLALWDFASPDARADEELFAADHFDGDESELRLQPAPVRPAAARVEAGMDVFSVREPRARLEQWRLALERKAGVWRLVGRELASQIDGLVHLSLDPAGVRADGLTLRLEDFELEMTRGTLFLSPASVGPTMLVFVGEGAVRVRPRPQAEREQLRVFCGKPELVDRVKTAFARIHPADLHRVLAPGRLVPDPEAPGRLAQAQRVFRDNSTSAYVLDAAAAPRSPWWLFPALGDASVVFGTRKHGTLTYTLSGGEAESVSLFDRARRRQICLYPLEGGSTQYDEDDGRDADILSHELDVRFDPARESLVGQDVLRVRLLGPQATLRLRLDEDLKVESVTSEQAGRHLFFRVRGYNSLMVSLGPLAGRTGEIVLTVRYSGVLHPGNIDHEMLQPTPVVGGLSEDEVPIEPVLVYANRSPWYPQGASDDYATARLRLEAPAGYAALSGGRRNGARVVDGRSVNEFVLERPGRYLTAVVGRLYDVGARQAGGVALQPFAVGRARGEAGETTALAAEILGFYESLFGPCPYPELTLALTEGYAPGGHSPPGMVILQQRPAVIRGALRDDPAGFQGVRGFFLAHELAHQWWGHGVAPQNYRERWISEAFAQYAAALWVRKARGEGAFREVLAHMTRWALREQDEGPIRLGHRLGHLKGDSQIFRAIVYDKGALVLNMLRLLLGDEAFAAALRRLQQDSPYTKIGSEDVRAAMEAVSGRALGPYFDYWLETTALPELDWNERRTPQGLELEIAARGLPGPLLLTVDAVRGAARARRQIELGVDGGRFLIEDAPPGARLELNADLGLLARVKKR